MTIFDNILNIFLPDYPMHFIFEFANRFKSQHILGFILALCTLGFQTQVGQAGIGTIDQVQVSTQNPEAAERIANNVRFERIVTVASIASGYIAMLSRM